MIKLIVLDVDGCMTSGALTFDANGIESKTFCVQDGFGIVSALKLGIEVAIITGRTSTIVQNRAKELGIKHLYQDVKDKHAVLMELLKKLDIKPIEVAAIGDDLIDYKMLSAVGKSFTPANGVDAVKKMANRVLLNHGGSGAVREMIDAIFKDEDMEDRFFELWCGSGH